MGINRVGLSAADSSPLPAHRGQAVLLHHRAEKTRPHVMTKCALKVSSKNTSGCDRDPPIHPAEIFSVFFVQTIEN